jgi:hypothetical protein
MSRRNGFATLCCFIAGCLALIGCGGGATGPRVKGQVLLDSQPVADARVEFQGKGGQSTVTDKDGKFEFDGTSAYLTVKPGTYKVTVTKYVDLKGNKLEPEDYEMQKAAGLVKHGLPAKYADVGTTDLTAEIKEGKNELKPFELKSK